MNRSTVAGVGEVDADDARPAAAQADDLDAVFLGPAGDGLDGDVEAGDVAAAGEDADPPNRAHGPSSSVGVGVPGSATPPQAGPGSECRRIRPSAGRHPRSFAVVRGDCITRRPAGASGRRQSPGNSS